MNILSRVFRAIDNLVDTLRGHKSAPPTAENPISIEPDFTELINATREIKGFVQEEQVTEQDLHYLGGEMVRVAQEVMEKLRASGELIDSFYYEINPVDQGGVSLLNDDIASYAIQESEFGRPPITRIMEWMNYIPDFASLTPVEFRQVAGAITYEMRANPKSTNPNGGSRIHGLNPVGERAYDYMSDVNYRMEPIISAFMDRQ